MGYDPDPDSDLAHLKSRIRIWTKIVRIRNIVFTSNRSPLWLNIVAEWNSCALNSCALNSCALNSCALNNWIGWISTVELNWNFGLTCKNAVHKVRNNLWKFRTHSTGKRGKMFCYCSADSQTILSLYRGYIFSLNTPFSWKPGFVHAACR
jgi:hypothetical protein